MTAERIFLLAGDLVEDRLARRRPTFFARSGAAGRQVARLGA